jgi:hypothetical protein
VIPELSTIQGITRDLNALARSLQGDYDGWEAKVENDLPTKGLSQ